jgi:hypothetical protein
LRDETAKRSAILEFIAALERLNRAVFAIAINHDHGEDVATWPPTGCSLIDMKEFVAAGISVYDLMQRQGALITWPPDLDTIKELREDTYLIEDTGYFTLDYYEDGHVNKDVFCEIGGKIACLELPTQNSIKFHRTELSKISAS